jgi:restriction system protein
MAVPSANAMMIPTIEALRRLGGSGRSAEIRGEVAQILGLSEEDQRIPHKNSNVSRLEYRLKWARTNLRLAGVISNSGAGVWTITPMGMSASDDDVLNWYKEWQKQRGQVARDQGLPRVEPDGDVDGGDGAAPADADEEADWEDVAIRAVQEMDPTRVEHLFLRLLREEGFEHLEHTGKAGDGGVDGTGVYRISLLSFRIFFQCKRYRDSIGPSDIRDFRGAMEGRGERGLFVTTSWFTKAAEDEASRVGARPVDLVDGPALARLLAKHGLGVKTSSRDAFEVVPSFFRDFRS